MPRLHELSSPVLDVLSAASGMRLRAPCQPVPPCLAAAVATLSAKFNHGEITGGKPYLEDSALRAAYLTYFLPVNLAKVQSLLEEAAPVIFYPTEAPFRFLDVGGGPGTGVLALLDWISTRPTGTSTCFDCTVLDHSSHALQLCQRLCREYGVEVAMTGRLNLNAVECNIEKRLPRELQEGINQKPYDLILMQNLLSELYTGRPDMIERRTALVEVLLSRLTPQGTLMLIEPALRSASRDLHLVRDRLLRQQSGTLYSPCLHEHACPALVKDDDWCHEDRKWLRPEWIERIDHAVGFIKDTLKFSYLILRKDGKTIVPRSSELHRVVSELREMKGEKRVWWCDESGRPEVGRLGRERSETNADFDDWHRGAIVRVSEIIRKERKGRPSTVGRIPASATVEIVRPV